MRMSGQTFLLLISFSILASLLLSGCAGTRGPETFEPKTTVRIVTETAYPEFPNISLPPPVRLLPFEVDYPRNPNELVVKNITSCVDVPEEERDDAFWARCGENPILVDSNIFIGLDQQNWNNVQENFQKLKENNIVLRQLLETANRQRELWRQQAQRERERVQQRREELLEEDESS